MFSHNLFKNLPQDLRTEVLETLFAQGDIKIERIISKGHDTDWMTQAPDKMDNTRAKEHLAGNTFSSSNRLMEAGF